MLKTHSYFRKSDKKIEDLKITPAKQDQIFTALSKYKPSPDVKYFGRRVIKYDYDPIKKKPSNNFIGQVISFNEKFEKNMENYKSIKEENDYFSYKYENTKNLNIKEKSSEIISGPQETFFDLICKYNEKGYKIPDLSVKKNLFEPSPLLMEDNKISDFYKLKLRNSGDNTSTSSHKKDIFFLHNFQLSINERLVSEEDKKEMISNKKAALKSKFSDLQMFNDKSKDGDNDSRKIQKDIDKIKSLIEYKLRKKKLKKENKIKKSNTDINSFRNSTAENTNTNSTGFFKYGKYSTPSSMKRNIPVNALKKTKLPNLDLTEGAFPSNGLNNTITTNFGTIGMSSTKRSNGNGNGNGNDSQFVSSFRRYNELNKINDNNKSCKSIFGNIKHSVPSKNVSKLSSSLLLNRATPKYGSKVNIFAREKSEKNILGNHNHNHQSKLEKKHKDLIAIFEQLVRKEYDGIEDKIVTYFTEHTKLDRSHLQPMKYINININHI
jgi:hypothetical protein